MDRRRGHLEPNQLGDRRRGHAVALAQDLRLSRSQHGRRVCVARMQSKVMIMIERCNLEVVMLTVTVRACPALSENAPFTCRERRFACGRRGRGVWLCGRFVRRSDSLRARRRGRHRLAPPRELGPRRARAGARARARRIRHRRIPRCRTLARGRRGRLLRPRRRRARRASRRPRRARLSRRRRPADPWPPLSRPRRTRSDGVPGCA